MILPRKRKAAPRKRTPATVGAPKRGILGAAKRMKRGRSGGVGLLPNETAIELKPLAASKKRGRGVRGR